jgi:hypothetical protein
VSRARAEIQIQDAVAQKLILVLFANGSSVEYRANGLRRRSVLTLRIGIRPRMRTLIYSRRGWVCVQVSCDTA